LSIASAPSHRDPASDRIREHFKGRDRSCPHEGVIWKKRSSERPFRDIDIPEDNGREAKEYREKLLEAASNSTTRFSPL